jgi:hypothetical protein
MGRLRCLSSGLSQICLITSFPSTLGQAASGGDARQLTTRHALRVGKHADQFRPVFAFEGEYAANLSAMIPTGHDGPCGTEAFRRSRTRFHRFDCAIARRRVGEKRIEQMLRSMSDIIDRTIESCLVRLGRFRETAQLPDELNRRSANFIVCRGWTEVMKCFDRSAHRKESMN